MAFAEIEKFIDTPVKHYSSGMYVRLAFAVAAHLEPEILLVDEVLAVGDINFQKKCLGKMGDVARAGRTVVLVSHQMNQIRRLCQRVAWVDGGAVRMIGGAHDVVSAYESTMRSREPDPVDRKPAGVTKAQFLRWEIDGTEVDSCHVLDSLDATTIRFILEVRSPILRGMHGIALYNADRQLMWGNASNGLRFDSGVHELVYEFPSLPLRPGPYSWLLSLFEDQEELDMWEATPDMIVATESYQHYRDEWSGS